MKVSIEIAGVPLYKTFGKSKKIEVEFPGKTMRELIDALVGEFGNNVLKALLSENGDFNARIRVLLNGVIYPPENCMRAALKNGDTLVFRAPS